MKFTLGPFQGLQNFCGVWMLHSAITSGFEEWLLLVHTYKLMLV
jgi:hypothetical protein